MITVKRKLHFTKVSKRRQRIQKDPVATETAGEGRVPWISRLIALAIHCCDQLVRDGEVAEQTELARLFWRYHM
ncbi:hypothetical protein CA54_21990 [Symmachiella macrocystis]|uniref:Uncharacterized protein n=1 Tax=Symmachiella macrocystis TaxID=2527985 RepID=A0A5C6BRQ3_9PLAN|nr:hypothetical protein CA54_21990 [Symmachiella macrocystis]